MAVVTASGVEYGRLTPHAKRFLDALPRGTVKGRSFLDWLMDQKRVHFGVRPYGAMRRGEAVDVRLLDGFREYLATPPWPSARPRVSALPEPFAAAAKRPADRDRVPEVDGVRWYNGRVTWMRVLAGLLGLRDGLVPGPRSECRDDRDVAHAASLFVEWIGRYSGAGRPDRLSRAEAQAAGERVMLRSVGGYARHLSAMWVRYPGIIRFSTLNGVHVGASMMLPFTKAGRDRFTSGGIQDDQLTPDDLRERSPWVCLKGLAPDPDATGSLTERARLAELRGMVCHMAAACDPVAGPDTEPTFYSVGGTPEAERLLTQFAWSRTHLVMPLTPRPLYELSRRTTAGSTRAMFSYQAVMAAIRTYQALTHGPVEGVD